MDDSNNSGDGIEIDNVGWSIDADSSSEDDIEINVKDNIIPRFDEPDWVEEEFQREFRQKLGKPESSKVIIKKSVEPFNDNKQPPKLSKKERKKQREKCKGPSWFNMQAPEMTEEVKNDLALLKMRSVLDPKHVYKKNDLSHTPKFFQVGKVLETPADFYNGRIPKAQRKRTLVDELLADVEASAHQKKKFKSIVDPSRRRRRSKNSSSKPAKMKKSKKSKK